LISRSGDAALSGHFERLLWLKSLHTFARPEGMMKSLAVMTTAFWVVAAAAVASDLEGPKRFCGYAPIIDLLPGETISLLEGGFHAGSFRWRGAFGSLEVAGIGWASRPRGRVTRVGEGDRPYRFAQRRDDDGYVVAIWNGAQGAAYFRSDKPFTRSQKLAIERVKLFQEGERPLGCDFLFGGPSLDVDAILED
jgi:hypothetical protein